MQAEQGPRRASVQSTTITDEQSAGQYDDVKESSDAGSQSKASPKTGKDYVAEQDGKSPMRDCEQRVRLLEMTTGIAPSDEKADGASLDGHGGHRPAGVEARAGCATTPEILVSAAPPQHMRFFSTLTEFYREFKRTAKQEFVEYEFRKNLKRLEDIGAKLDGFTKAYTGFWRRPVYQRNFS